MDELQKLYDVLVREGKYTKSFEEFQAKWSQDQPYKDKVYDVVSKNGLYTKDKNSFLQKYSVSGATPQVEQSIDLKKKGQTPVGVSALPLGGTSLALPKTKPETEEEDYFTGAFGNVLRGFDNIIPIGIGDFVDDIARSVASGYRQGTVAQEADNLLLKGTKATPEQIQKFIDANKSARQLGPSAEMQQYQNIYEKEGKGFWGVVKGLASNPSIIHQVLTSSLTAMVTNADALKAGAAAIGTGAGIGAGIGAAAGGVGAIPGAGAGATTAVPYAFGLASSIVEMGSTFGELLEEQLGGKEMTKENVKAILEDPEKLNSIRNKAIARGAIIGTVDALTGKLASGVGAKIIGKSAAGSATGSITRGAVTRATAAGSAIESLGGSLGEAMARGAIGQEMDVSEIALEGIAELPGGIRSTIQGRLAKPEYKVNGAKVSAQQLDELINTMSPTDLAKTKIEIKNDYAGREFKIQDKIVTDAIKQQVKQGDSELNEPSLNAITQLEKDLKSLEGNTTQTGKDKAAAIRSQIKNIQENQLQDEGVVAIPVSDGGLPKAIDKQIVDNGERIKVSDDYANYLLDEIDRRHREKYPNEDARTALALSWQVRGSVRGVATANSTLEDTLMNYIPESVRAEAYQALRKNFEKAKSESLLDNQPQPPKEGVVAIPVITNQKPFENSVDEAVKGTEITQEQADGATVETLFHEKGHGLKTIMEDIADNATPESKEQALADEKAIQNWVGAKGRDWTRAQNEKLANGFTEYLRTGKSPTEALKGVFERLKEWLGEVFSAAKSTSKDINLPQDVVDAFDRLLGKGQPELGLQEVVSASNNVSEGVSEFELPGYNDLASKVDEIIATQTSKKRSPKKIESNVMSVVKNSVAYKNATDVQKELLIREARKKLGLKEKSAPSVKRLRTEAAPSAEGESLFSRFFGAVKKDKKVTMTEMSLLKKQIKDLARGAKDAKSAWMAVSNELYKGIKALTTRGTITDTQAKNVLRKFSKVNMFSQKSVDSFIDYMTNVFANAEYSSKLSQANGLKKDISKLARNKDKNANLRDLAQQFVKIAPSMVDDIDAYNEMAAKIKEAIKGSTIRAEKVTFANTVNIENATEYVDKTMKAQDEKMRERKAEEIQDLMGIDASEFSYDEMMELLGSKEPITKNNEGIIRSTIKKMFDIYSTLIETTLDTGKDPFTDEDVEFTKTQRNLIRRFMDMDLTVLKPKEALQAVDALANFFQNKSTAKMEAVLAEYTGSINARDLLKNGIVAQPLKKYWSEKFGRFLGEQTTNLNILFEKMFKGFSRGGMVEDASGVTKLKNNKSMAERESNNIVEQYVAKFYKKKANGEAFNSEYNSVERGLAAFMMRNVIGTEQQMIAEFNRRKSLIEQSIKVLSEGNEKEVAKSELYQEVYDKIVKGSESIQDVKDKTDATNLEGIDFWNKEWADKYEQLSDVSLNIYNKVLDKDINYTPDRFVKLSAETGPVELSNEESAFHNNNGTIYKKETGVLMTAVKPENLPTNPKSGDTSMYIDLSFDKNNSNAMYDALIDMGTAAPIRQIEAFLNSTDFKKIVPKAEDAKVLKDRIQLYVGNIRNKNPYSNDELSAVVRGLNKIAAIGVGQALGGVLQPVKQMIPVAINTLINAGNLDMGAMFDSAKNGFINRSGYAISNRGIESQAQVESLNKLIDEASKTKGQQLIKNIEKLNKWWLQKFLVNPDVFIARASWMTYYEQSLKNQGVDTKGIDYETHEVNEEAADYAQRMVDRQQNVSDSDLAGKMFSNKESSNQLIVKMLMPFASFRMNQSARLGADLAVLTDKTSTTDDRKIAIRSLSGFAVEMATFKMVAAGSAILIGSITRLITGDDEDEEEYKKRVNNIIKGQVTSSFTDVVSPLPILDKAFQKGGNFLTESVLGIPKESVFSVYNVAKQEYVQSLGLFGIAADRAGQLYEIGKLSTTGKYVDDFGKEKEISDDSKKALRFLIGPAILTNVGLAPVEVNSIVRNAIKNAKKGKAKSAEDIEAKAERDESKEESLSQKIEALNTLRNKAVSDNEVNAIDEKIAELEATPEEKKELEVERKEERELKKELLTDPDTGEEYDNQTQLKRYNPRLYEENFGTQSDWFKDHKEENKVDKKIKQAILKIKDSEQGYVKPKKRNSDGSSRRSSRN